jgi:hypothetical protein
MKNQLKIINTAYNQNVPVVVINSVNGRKDTEIAKLNTQFVATGILNNLFNKY